MKALIRLIQMRKRREKMVIRRYSLESNALNPCVLNFFKEVSEGEEIDFLNLQSNILRCCSVHVQGGDMKLSVNFKPA